MDNNIFEAINILKKGGLILYPTDTIWGIGCDGTNPEAVDRVYKLKKREDSKALVMLASNLDMVARYIEEIPQMAIQLVEVNDAPMTIIYPGATGLANNAIAEDGSVGIRIPLSGSCLELVQRFGKPLVSTSANISGEPAPKSFSEISQHIKDGVDFILPQSPNDRDGNKASQIIKVALDGEIKIIRG